MDGNIQTTSPQVKANWVKITDGKFICPDCDNEVVPHNNTTEGIVEADLEKIKADLIQYPTKISLAICPECAMEFVFKVVDDELYIEPSVEEK